MSENQEIQAAIDNEHLRLLSVGYKISAGVAFFTSLFGLMYMLMGIMFSVFPNTPSQHQQPPVDWIFGITGFAFFAISIIFAILNLMAAKRLEQRRAKTFCTIIAALNCVGIPYHTVLGIFTLMVLTRRSVETTFDANNK